MASESEDPADVFQELFADISPLIGRHFVNVTNGLFRKRIITRQEISGIESRPNLNDGQRGTKVAFLLYDKIKESDDPVQCLLKICDVFESGTVNDASLKKHGANMRSNFTSSISASNVPHTESSLSSKSEGAEAETEEKHKAVRKQMEEGYVSLKSINMVIYGPPGVGKTSFQDLLRDKPHRKEYKSTPIARPIQIIAANGDKSWEKVTPDDLLEMLNAPIQEDKPTQSTSTSHVSLEEPDTATTPETGDNTKHSSSATDDTRPMDEDYTSDIITRLAGRKGSQKLLEATWIHLLDIGGQPQFTDLLHNMFVHDNSLYIIVMKATESLHDKPTLVYSNGEPVTAQEEMTMTNLELIKNFIRSIIEASPSTITEVGSDQPPTPAFAIIATHYDEYEQQTIKNETLEKKNKILKDCFKNISAHFIFSCDCKKRDTHSNECQLLFPVNNWHKPEEGRGRVSANIRDRFMSRFRNLKPKPIPTRYYILEIKMKEASKKNTDKKKILKKSYVDEIGQNLGMNKSEVKECLEYLDSLRLCIYDHEILSHVVFTSPQFLIDCLSNIVRVSIVADVHKILPEVSTEAIQLLKRDGVFDESLLDNLGLTFIPDLFSKSDLLKLLQHFNVISPIKADANTDTSQYFMPILLPPKRLAKEQKGRLEEKNDPLHITFKDRIFPKSLFPTMVVSLLSREKEPCFSIDCSSDDFPRQLRHAIKLYSENFCGSVILCEEYESIEVYFDVHRKHYYVHRKHYYVLRKVILKALEASAKKLGYDEEHLKVSAIVKLREMSFILTSEHPSSSQDKKSDTHDSASSTISFYDILERSKTVKDWETFGHDKLKVEKEDILRIRNKCHNQPRVCLKELLHHCFNTPGQAELLNEVLPQSTEEKSSTDCKKVKGDYEVLKKKFKSLIKSFITEAEANIQLEKVKQAWVKLMQDKLKNEAEAMSNIKIETEAVKDEESLRALLQQYCFLSNISLLKCLAEKLNLKDSIKQSIDELADERDGFYTSLLSDDGAIAEIEDHEEMHNYKQIRFVLEDSSETMLAELHHFLENNFEDLISIRAIQRGSSVVCNLLNEGTQLFKDFLCSMGCYIKVVTNETTLYLSKNKAPMPQEDFFREIRHVQTQYKSFDECINENLIQDIKVLLMTATEIELQGIMGYLKPKKGRERIIETILKKEKVYIGKFGKYPVVVGMSAPGRAKQGPLDACLVTITIMMEIKLRYVISVGICYGMDKRNTSPGDVIVSDLVIDATCLRVGDITQLRGGIYPVGATLLSVFRTPTGYSHTYQGDKEVKVHCGPFIARPDLVDNPKYKEELKNLWYKALGGEMEGAGIMAATTRHNVEAIVIKVICDWGDGEKSEVAGWKPFSSHAAARYVYHQMEKHYDVLIEEDKERIVASKTY